jgi:hypothetical protein
LLNPEVLSLILVVLFFAMFFAVVAWKKPRSKNNRTKNLLILIIIDGLFFSIGLVVLLFFLPQTPLNILSWVVYDFLITYALCIEVSAYLRISIDDNLSKILKDLREELIGMQFSFGNHIQRLKTKRTAMPHISREKILTSCCKILLN